MNFKEQYYCVIDVETTGNRISNNRMTEICMVRMLGSKVIEKFTSLIDPESLIPDFITSLTGIDNEMVAAAPLFSEVAE
ncbi:MAG: DNA polymerase-3 subunit epsilon, partial [Nonlabens sp.]